MNDLQTLEAIRLDIVGELEAVSQYEAHAAATNNPKAKKIWQSIANEERMHAGELFALLFELDPITAEMFLKGQQEAKDMMRAMTFNQRR